MAFSNDNGSIINFNNDQPMYRSTLVASNAHTTHTHAHAHAAAGHETKDVFAQPLFDDHHTVRAIGSGYQQTLSDLAPLPGIGGLKELSLSSAHTSHSQHGRGFDSLMNEWPYGAPINNGAKELSFVAITTAASIDDCPTVPVYVEQYTTFIVGRRAVFDDIVTHLQTIGVDHSVHEHKIRGLVYPADRAGACEFRVYRYKCEDAGQWMIEVQRRSGCIFAFNQLYRSIVAITQSYHIIPATDSQAAAAAPALLASLPPLDLPKVAAEPVGDLLISTVEPLTVKQLATMASSTAVEVAREGIEALAVLSSMSNGHAAAVATHAKALTLPVSLLTIAATMVATARAPTARAAADLIANICAASREGVTLSLACPTMVSSLLNMLDAPTSLSLRDTKRQCARAIASMASTDITSLRRQTLSYDAAPTSAFTTVAILERYTGTDDIALRSSVVTALSLLRA